MAPMHTTFPYPRDLFLRFIRENDGEVLCCHALHAHLHPDRSICY